MRKILCFLVLIIFGSGLLLAQPVVRPTIYTPDSSVLLAAADLASISPEERPYIRYLSLYNIQKEKRQDLAKLISFLVNSLGTRRRMYIPFFVGGSDETVIRLNIDDYEWRAQDWENLGKKGSGPKSLIVAAPEPYFHAFIDKPSEPVKKKVKRKVTKTKQVFIGYDQYSRPVYRPQNYEVEKEVEEEVPGKTAKKKVLAGAPWVDAKSLAFLISETQSEFPIMRADWFFVNACVPPAYYDFLRLGKSIKDFDNLIFANEALAKKARSQDKAVVITSTVARNNRTLVRSPTFTGGYRWSSHDSKTSVEDRQYILNLLKEKFDATEDIGTLSNGLQAYFLTDGNGNRLDEADINIAIDNTAVDRVVRSGRSCIICHAEGIRPIDDEVRSLTKRLQNAEQVRLLVPDRKDARRVDDLFGSDLDKQIVKDNNLYAEAVALSNGSRTEVNAKSFGVVYNAYAEELMTKEVVARDLGVPVMELEQVIRLSADPVALGLIKVPIRPVRRDQWEASFQNVMLIVLVRKFNAVPIGAPLPAPVPVFAPAAKK